jgi:hypothetical protein
MSTLRDTYANALDHLAFATHSPQDQTRRLLMLKLTVYSDDSGLEDRDFFCIAGFLGSQASWAEINEPWAAELDNEWPGLEPQKQEFKASDCFMGQGRYADWTATRRFAHGQRLLQIIDGVPQLRGFGVAFDMLGWEKEAARIKKHRVLGYDKAYLVAFQYQLQQIASEFEHSPPAEDIGFVFDHQQGFEGKAFEVYWFLRGQTTPELMRMDPALPVMASRYGALTFDDSWKLPGLQAADLLAWTARRVLWEERYPRARSRRLPLPINASIDYLAAEDIKSKLLPLLERDWELRGARSLSEQREAHGTRPRVGAPSRAHKPRVARPARPRGRPKGPS